MHAQKCDVRTHDYRTIVWILFFHTASDKEWRYESVGLRLYFVSVCVHLYVCELLYLSLTFMLGELTMHL